MVCAARSNSFSHQVVDVITPFSKQPATREFPKAAVERVVLDLKKREAQLQLDIIQLMPLVKFVAPFVWRSRPEAGQVLFCRAESSQALRRQESRVNRDDSLRLLWLTHCRSALIRSAQVILDRLKEARHSIGVTGFGDEIRDDFTRELSPYRVNLL
jgi:hypothetical protein